VNHEQIEGSASPSRREFVAGSAVAGAALFLPGALFAALDGKKTFTIACRSRARANCR
jgi:hypothetical protein